jgi:putative zinc finger/helix-turn-helix YgiT family protein
MNENTCLLSQTELECPLCESHNIRTQHEREQFAYGTKDFEALLTAYIPIHKCEACEYEFVGEKADTARHESICQHLGLLTPSEIKEIRVRTSGSQKTFADFTGIGEASIQRWEQGQILQSKSNDLLLRLLRFEENVIRTQQYRQRKPMDKECLQNRTFVGRALDATKLGTLARSSDQFTLKRKTG